MSSASTLDLARFEMPKAKKQKICKGFGFAQRPTPNLRPTEFYNSMGERQSLDRAPIPKRRIQEIQGDIINQTQKRQKPYMTREEIKIIIREQVHAQVSTLANDMHEFYQCQLQDILAEQDYRHHRQLAEMEANLVSTRPDMPYCS